MFHRILFCLRKVFLTFESKSMNHNLRMSKKEIGSLSVAGKEKMKGLLMDNENIDITIDSQGYIVSIVNKPAENLLRQYLNENRYSKDLTKDMQVDELWKEVKDMLAKK